MLSSHLRNLCHERFDRIVHRSDVNCEFFRIPILLLFPFSHHLLIRSLDLSRRSVGWIFFCLSLFFTPYISKLSRCYSKSVAINISFHHLKCSSRLLLSFDRSIEVSFDPWGSLIDYPWSTVDIQWFENNDSRIMPPFFLLACAGLTILYAFAFEHTQAKRATSESWFLRSSSSFFSLIDFLILVHTFFLSHSISSF